MPMKKRKRIDKTDRAIFRTVARARRPIPIRRIAKRTGISWPTAKKRVTKLQNLGVLKNQKSIRRNNISATPTYLRKLESSKKS